MDNNHILYSRGDNWFHFRIDIYSMLESFCITYCHDGTVCMTGDMGCLAWIRTHRTTIFDYGFPYRDTGIEYFAEKVARADTEQVIRTWDRARAANELIAASHEDRDNEDIEALEYVHNSMYDEEGEYGYYNMLSLFDNVSHGIETEELCGFGIGYTPMFVSKYNIIRSISEQIINEVKQQ